MPIDKKTLQFVELVSKMRQAQKNYFRTRGKNYLDESKQLERRVDEMAKEFRDTQQELFN